MPLRRLGISAEWEVTISVALILVMMFACTEMIAKKLDRINEVHLEQLRFLKEMQTATNRQDAINQALSVRLQSIENELKMLQANQADTLISLRGKQNKKEE